MSFHSEFLLLVTVIGTIRFTSAEGYRLPDTQIPSTYDIHLTFPDEIFNGETKIFSGVVSVTFESSVSTKIIIIHAPGDVKSAQLVLESAPSNSLTINKVEYNSITELLSLSLEDELVTNSPYTLTFEYDTKIDVIDRRGIYRTTYEESLSEKYLINTQFQPTYARKAFPCFDEPRFKANFTLSLTFPSVGYNAFSNTGQKSKEESESG